MNETRRLCEHAAGITVAKLPPKVVEQAKQLTLDMLGVAVRAQHDCDSSPSIARTVDMLCGGEGTATAAGHRRLYPPHYAALLNGAYAHSLEFDDTHAAGSIHPGAPVIAAALAMAEDGKSDGATLVAAIVAGYEVACRISLGLTPTVHLNKGFHPTATCGTFGAAAAAGVCLGLPVDTLESALGICGSLAAGSMQYMEDGSWNKRVHSGTASHNGVMAALFAKNGLVGARQAVEGRRGFLHAYSDAGRPEKVLEGLGTVWAVADTGVKLYPTCRSTHSPMDSILHIMRTEGLSGPEVKGIRIGISTKGVDLVGAPEARKREPQNDVDAQFSMHWTGAVAALKGRMTWGDYALLRDPEVLDLARRITVFVDPEADAMWPGHFASSVVIEARGREYRRFVNDCAGDPALPVTWADLESKFLGLAEQKLGGERCRRIIGHVKKLEALADLKPLTALLRV